MGVFCPRDDDVTAKDLLFSLRRATRISLGCDGRTVAKYQVPRCSASFVPCPARKMLHIFTVIILPFNWWLSTRPGRSPRRFVGIPPRSPPPRRLQSFAPPPSLSPAPCRVRDRHAIFFLCMSGNSNPTAGCLTAFTYF